MSNIKVIFKEKGKSNVIITTNSILSFSILIQNYYNKVRPSKKEKERKKFIFKGKEISPQSTKLLCELDIKDYSELEIVTTENMITSQVEEKISTEQLKLNFKKSLYNFIPKNYKNETRKIIKEISNKYTQKKQKNENNNNINNNKINLSNSIETIKDITLFSTIVKDEIQKEKKEHPEKIIPIQKAVESPKTTSLFAIGILASFLESNGTDVIIKKGKDENSILSNQECLETCMTFFTSDVGMSEKYELKFDLDETQNEKLLSNENEAENFLNSWKQKISKEIGIPVENIIFFNPRKGSFVVDVIFLQPKAEEFLPEFRNLKQKYKELLEVNKKILLDGCVLSEDILDSNYNKQLGTWNKSGIPKRGGETYEPPHGWIGFGLNILHNNMFNADLGWIGHENSPGEWIVVYHGIRKSDERNLSETQIVNSITKTHLRPGWNQYHEEKKDIRHKLPIGNEKCNKCDRIFTCVYDNYQFYFNRCGESKKCPRCNNVYECDKCLHGVYCSPKTDIIEDYTTAFSVPNSEEKYRIGFMCRADPEKIRQSDDEKNYYICSGEFDELIPYRIIIKEESIKFIEDWTRKKIISIVFDSDEDNWETGKEFSQYIIGKSNLLFMIDDEQNNRFGGYINSKITESDKFIHDDNAFIFSLRSNGRLSKPTQFKIKNPEDAFISITDHDRYIFAFGGGYDIKLDSKKTANYANSNPSSYDFRGHEDALYGKIYPNRFTPKRWVVYQMK